VPDLQLFPARYGVTERVCFEAGLEVTITPFLLWLIAALVRIGVVRDVFAFAYPQVLQRYGTWFDALGTGTRGMHIGITGTGHDGRAARLDWHLVAKRGHGPEMPCIAAIVIARGLAAGRMAARGAMPCMGLMALAQFAEEVSNLDIEWRAVWG
jgi:hypothetical protein